MIDQRYIVVFREPKYKTRDGVNHRFTLSFYIPFRNYIMSFIPYEEFEYLLLELLKADLDNLNSEFLEIVFGDVLSSEERTEYFDILMSSLDERRVFIELLIDIVKDDRNADIRNLYLTKSLSEYLNACFNKTDESIKDIVQEFAEEHIRQSILSKQQEGIFDDTNKDSEKLKQTNDAEFVHEDNAIKQKYKSRIRLVYHDISEKLKKLSLEKIEFRFGSKKIITKLRQVGLVQTVVTRAGKIRIVSSVTGFLKNAVIKTKSVVVKSVKADVLKSLRTIKTIKPVISTLDTLVNKVNIRIESVYSSVKNSIAQKIYQANDVLLSIKVSVVNKIDELRTLFAVKNLSVDRINSIKIFLSSKTVHYHSNILYLSEFEKLLTTDRIIALLPEEAVVQRQLKNRIVKLYDFTKLRNFDKAEIIRLIDDGIVQRKFDLKKINIEICDALFAAGRLEVIKFILSSIEDLEGIFDEDVLADPDLLHARFEELSTDVHRQIFIELYEHIINNYDSLIIVDDIDQYTRPGILEDRFIKGKVDFGFEEVYEQYLGKDRIDIPPTDYDYRKLADYVYNKETGEVYNHQSDPNEAVVKIGTPIEHPFESTRDYGTIKEIDVDLEVIRDVLYLMIVQHRQEAYKLAGLTAKQGLDYILDFLRDVIEHDVKEVSSKEVYEQYKRVFRLLRWYSEYLLFNEGSEIWLKREYEPWYDGIQSTGDIQCEYINDGFVIDSIGLIESNGLGGYLELKLENKVNSKFEFSFANTVTDSYLYIDGEKIFTIPYNTVDRVSFDVPAGVHSFRFTYSSPALTEKLKLSGLVLHGYKFKSASVEYRDREDITGFKIVKRLIQMLAFYYDIHHGQSKTKGRRDIWIN